MQGRFAVNGGSNQNNFINMSWHGLTSLKQGVEELI